MCVRLVPPESARCCPDVSPIPGNEHADFWGRSVASGAGPRPDALIEMLFGCRSTCCAASSGKGDIAFLMSSARLERRAESEFLLKSALAAACLCALSAEASTGICRAACRRSVSPSSPAVSSTAPGAYSASRAFIVALMFPASLLVFSEIVATFFSSSSATLSSSSCSCSVEGFHSQITGSTHVVTMAFPIAWSIRPSALFSASPGTHGFPKMSSFPCHASASVRQRCVFVKGS
mmetsp:Transcript_35594/g.57186  ORF Transcript_35594/g.57186 Transcript_35594/m.57186 type:complete len:235 (-) Transcript_35594:485-1189(-)